MAQETVYLLTGATGFLGTNTARALVDRGAKVYALVMENDRALQYVPKGVQIVYGNLLDTASLDSFCAAAGDAETIVLHCASFVTVDPAWNQRVYDVNVGGTANIIDMCLRHNVKKLVYVSSTGAIPELPHGKNIIEVKSFEPGKVVGCYQQTKAAATQLVIDAVREKNLNASIVYPSGICGPNDFSMGLFTQAILDYAQGKIPAGIDGSFNSVDVRDLASGVIACADKGRKGEGYILSNCHLSMQELFRLVSKYAGNPEAKLYLPIWAAKIMAALMALNSKITKKPPLITKFSIYNLARNNNFSHDKATIELGYTTRPIEETIADSVRWLQQEGKIGKPEAAGACCLEAQN
jgi:dihydroflavonol-4-reductase